MLGHRAFRYHFSFDCLSIGENLQVDRRPAGITRRGNKKLFRHVHVLFSGVVIGRVRVVCRGSSTRSSFSVSVSRPHSSSASSSQWWPYWLSYSLPWENTTRATGGRTGRTLIVTAANRWWEDPGVGKVILDGVLEFLKRREGFWIFRIHMGRHVPMFHLLLLLLLLKCRDQYIGVYWTDWAESRSPMCSVV